MSVIARYLLLACLCGSALPVSAHNAALPDLGDSARAGFSVLQEQMIGRQAIAKMHEVGALVEDVDGQQYLQQLGQRLLQHSPMSEHRYRFLLIDDNSINAFAMPGGVIGIHSGLLFTAENESELASVLAHEMAHVSQRHIARMVEQQGNNSLLMFGTLLAAILAASVSGNHQVAAAAANVGPGLAIQNQLAYSRDFEREADRLGMEILLKAGFNPQGMSDFFRRLHQSTRLNDNNALGFLRTHPMSSERLTESESRAANLPSKMVADSLDFLLLRERLRVKQQGALAAIRFYEEALQQGRFRSEAVTQYGLAYAQAQAKQWPAAQLSLQRSEKLGPPHPALTQLAATIQLGQHNAPAALATLQQGRQRWPAHVGLVYAEIDAALWVKDRSRAQSLLESALKRWPEDPALWQKQAKLYADREPLRYHYALGNGYFYQHRFGPALEQYQLAHDSQGEDFYLRSVLDVRMREAQQRLQEEKNAKS